MAKEKVPCDHVTRLRFTENELTDEKVRRAAAKAERAADRAEEAQAKLPKKTRMRLIRENAEAAGEQISGSEARAEREGKYTRDRFQDGRPTEPEGNPRGVQSADNAASEPIGSDGKSQRVKSKEYAGKLRQERSVETEDGTPKTTEMRPSNEKPGKGGRKLRTESHTGAKAEIQKPEESFSEGDIPTPKAGYPYASRSAELGRKLRQGRSAETAAKGSKLQSAGNTLRDEKSAALGSKLHEAKPSGAADKDGGSKLRPDKHSDKAMRSKLRLDKEETNADKPGLAGQTAKNASRAAVNKAMNAVRDSVDEEDDGNAGVEALDAGKTTAHVTGDTVSNVRYSQKLRQYEKAERLVEKSDKANVEALYQKSLHDHPETASNPISRFRQKQAIRKQYAAAKRAENTAAAGAAGASATASKASGAVKETKTLAEKGMAFVKKHQTGILIILVLGFLIVFISSTFSSCSVIMSGMGQGVIGTSYTAEDTDISGVEADYTALEAELRSQIDNIEATHAGYDEYRYNLAEIGHNPYELASYLTVLFEDYTREEVQGALRDLFEAQYTLTLEEEVEVRTRTETRTGTMTVTDPETGETYEEEYEYEVEVEYNYHILNVTLTNRGIGAVARSSGLTDDQMERYDVLLETRGNRDDLFADVEFAVPGEYTDYDIPGEALTDEKFANMIQEAEKYLGYPYVWGGSSPSTSFDCSGFVSWVINHCGNGWNVGRQTANGLMGCCDIIPASEARPGDLIFFQGTYDTSGASHVGIYVGGGMMIHCGNPISYANIQTSYWQQHFYCYGRIRG